MSKTLLFYPLLTRLPTLLSTIPLQMLFVLPTSVQALQVRTETTSPQACPRKEFDVLRFESLSAHEEGIGFSEVPLQGYPRSVTAIPFYFKSCLKATRIYHPAAYRKHLIRDSGAPRFMLHVYGFDLSDRIWLVSIVMALVVACLLGCVFSTILAGPPYIPLCMYHLPKRHMCRYTSCHVPLHIMCRLGKWYILAKWHDA